MLKTDFIEACNIEKVDPKTAISNKHILQIIKKDKGNTIYKPKVMIELHSLLKTINNEVIKEQ